MPEARQLAPEADLATVLHLATDALQRGVMLDPEELLCQLYGLNEAQLLEHLEDNDPPCWECGRGTFASDREEEKAPPAAVRDQSGLARARALSPAKWRQAEAGVQQHLVLTGRALCGSDDAGPWRFVSGTNLCPACEKLEEVLGRHG